MQESKCPEGLSRNRGAVSRAAIGRRRVDAAARDDVVLSVMLDRSSGRDAVTVSLRDITKQTGISPESARQSIQRLIKSGAIEKLKSSGHTAHASRYSILSRPESAIQAAFLWSNYGLGQTARLICEELSPVTWLTARQVAEAVGCSIATVRKALLKLHSAGLVDGRNVKIDRNPRKTHWQRFEDDDYADFYSRWLTDSAAQQINTKMERQQAEWRSRERARMRETMRPVWDKRDAD
jgi:predicted transcriptional regulator